MEEKDIIDTYNEILSYSTLRSLEVLNFMKESAILRLKESKKEVISDDIPNLRTHLQEKLKFYTGKTQIKGFGDVYFIPTIVEFIDVLKKFVKMYPKYRDFNKITKILENHIESCYKKNSFAPSLKYFIYKQGTGSRLASAYESFDELEEKTHSNTTDF
jgi:hypothetical protein